MLASANRITDDAIIVAMATVDAGPAGIAFPIAFDQPRDLRRASSTAC